MNELITVLSEGIISAASNLLDMAVFYFGGK